MADVSQPCLRAGRQSLTANSFSMKKQYGPPKPPAAPRYIGLFIALVITFSAGWNAGLNHNNQANSFSEVNEVSDANGKSEAVNLAVFWDVWNILTKFYVDPHKLNSQEMVYGAVKGMVASLGDPYTVFMTPEENREFQDVLEGHLQGIGAELTLRDGMLMVVSPLKGSPAQAAGLQPEDVIYTIDGEDTSEMSLEQAVMKIRGEKGTSVKLGILRKSSKDPIELEIVRNDINVNSVEWKMKGGIALIEINQFGDSTKEEFSKAVSAILTQNPKGVVLDLRFNGGGYLGSAVDILSEFVERDKVVTIKKRNSEEDETIYANDHARMLNLPLVVLINKGSASASEIVAGAIQDLDRGTLVGEESFGKGTVQEVQNLIGGASLRVTIAKWFTPKGQNINETGITPDVVVERTEEDYNADRDPQLEKALEILNKGS